ncbi:MAG: hypothetical protein ACXV7J_14620 [Methylomonas sp.]
MNAEDFEGLKALLESAFPKTCRNCGHIYLTAEQFFAETLDMPSGRSSLKMAIEDDGAAIVEAFRNCRCGSTLMDEFGCRRDHSESGLKRRTTFNRMLSLLLARNIPEEEARAEIVNFLRGRSSQLQAWLNADSTLK